MVRTRVNYKKKKDCKRGFECGFSCIARIRVCRSNIGANGKKIIETYNQYLNRTSQLKTQGKKIDSRFEKIFLNPNIDPINGEVRRNKELSIKNQEVNGQIISTKYESVYSVGDNYITADAFVKSIDSFRLSLIERQLKELGVDANQSLKEANINFQVNGTFNSGETSYNFPEKLSESETIKRVSTAIRVATSEVLASIPEGTIVKNTAYFLDGKGNSREKLYQRAGFGKPHKDDFRSMIALKRDGKLIPINPPGDRVATKLLPTEPVSFEEFNSAEIDEFLGVNLPEPLFEESFIDDLVGDALREVTG